MDSYIIVNPDTWKRKEHYYFFKSFSEPYTGLVMDVEVGKAFDYCKSNSISFFRYYLHKSIIAVNEVEAFRLRMVDNELRLYKEIHASATISKSNGTFGFSHIVYSEDFNTFSTNFALEKERIEHSTSLFPPKHSENVIHYSAMPWIKFTGLSHARNHSVQDTCPKISFGKVYEDYRGRTMMPMSVHVHHSLVDGKDIAEYLECFQELLNKY